MKSILVTGASTGIGRAIALEMASEYDYIAIAGFSHEEELLSLKSEILSSYDNKSCHAFVGDISNYDFAKTMISTIIEEAHEITSIVNNAGISYVELFTDTTPERWNRICNVNINSVYNVCHNAIPYMIDKKFGKIINISSVWGEVGASCEVAYSATKGAINSFSRALAKELALSNISVNAISFGVIDTPMNSHLDENEKATLCDEIPFGRMADTKEAATFIKQLLAMPTYHTGDIVRFDGGFI